MYLRKFYDTGVADTGGGRATIVAEHSPREVADMYRATTPAAEKEPAAENPVVKETVAPIETEKPVTKTEEPAKPVQTEEPKPTTKIEEPKPVVPVQETPNPIPQTPAQKKTYAEFLKEEGFDDFAIKALDYYKQTGDLTPYIKVKSIDYKNMAPEEIMRHDLREQYPDLDEDALDIIYREDVASKYLLDPDSHSEAEVKAAKARLIKAAEPKRKQFLEYQEQFTAPTRNTEAEQQAAAQAQAEAIRQRKESISNNPVTQKFLTDKRLVIPYGDNGEQLTFEVPNPSDVLQTITNDEAWIRETHEQDAQGNLIVDKNGLYVPNTKSLLETVALKKYISQIVKQAREEGIAEGSKKFITEATNPDMAQASTPGDPDESFADAIKKRGVKHNW